MAYDEVLADRLRDVVTGEPDLTEKKMFGGLAFLVAGNMAVAANSRGDLMVRVDPNRAEALLAEPHARPVEMRGREMRGWLHVDMAGLESDADLQRWTEIGLSYAGALPPK